MGITSWAGTHFVQLALMETQTVKVAPINYLQVAIAWVADILLFNKQATKRELLATFCIVFFTFANQVYKGFCRKK